MKSYAFHTKTLQSSHKIQCVVYLHSEARNPLLQTVKLIYCKWQAVSYGTITSNGAATTQMKNLSTRANETRASYIINPKGRVNICHMKPQPCKESQLINAQNEMRQVNLASKLTMVVKKKSQINKRSPVQTPECLRFHLQTIP